MKIHRETQDRLLAQSIESCAKFCDILAANGLSYDDLRYNDSFSDKEYPAPEFHSLDELAPQEAIIPAISFFSGAGGLNIGFKYAGFDNAVSVEHTELFCNTLRLNNPDKTVIGPPQYAGDIRDRETIAEQLRGLGISTPFNGVFHGGPPCQSFSIAANQRFSKDDDNFKRKGFDDEEKGSLLFDYVWLIREFKPLAFMIENVGGITEFDKDGRIGNVLDDLRDIGYRIPKPQVLDAAYYGVPQHRKRWIVLGTRGTRPITYPRPNLTPMPCIAVFKKSLDKVKNHEIRMHKAASVSRYAQLAPGERDHLGRVDRLDAAKPSKTVIAGGVKGGGRSHLHPFIPRTISVRECARLQTFPDSYVFYGTTARQFTQVGNAVPPLLAYKIALKIKEAIIDDYVSHRQAH